MASLTEVRVTAGEALWPYQVTVEREPDRAGKPRPLGAALAWLPSATVPIRGIIVAGSLGIENELVIDPAVRAAAADAGIGMVFFTPQNFGVFHFWAPGNRDGERLLGALDGLAGRSGHPELARVPWITMGHSTAGIYCRNAAYWRPERVAGVLSFKSGNFFQAANLPPQGSLIGIPLVSINGQVETFGPEGGLRPEWGRETQWRAAQLDLQRFRAMDEQYLMQNLVHPGQDHFHGGSELADFTAVWLRAIAATRLAIALPSGTMAIAARPLSATSGWLSDAQLGSPRHPPAPVADYAGDRRSAMWHIDRSVAEATARLHRNLDHHQCLEAPTVTWSEDGEDWIFTATARWLDIMPPAFAGVLGGKAVGHADSPFQLLAKSGEPVQALGQGRFRVLRPIAKVNIMAWHPGDAQFRSTGSWATIEVPLAKTGTEQTITFPSPGPVRAGTKPLPLQATASSGLAIFYEVNYGPVTIHDGIMELATVSETVTWPLPVKITAWQIGQRGTKPIRPAAPVTLEFTISAP